MKARTKLDFIGLGVHKGGSSWMYQVLFDHPQVYLLAKELHFFSIDRVWQRGITWYESLYASAKESSVKGDISVSYFSYPESVERIYHQYPNVKLFVCLRDPVDRAFSHYKHNIKMGHVKSDVSFEEALEANPNYLKHGRYALHMKRFLEYFPRDQILVLFFDDLRKSPDLMASELFDFLGIENNSYSRVTDTKINSARMPRSFMLDKNVRKFGDWLKKTDKGRSLWWWLKGIGLTRIFYGLNSSDKKVPEMSSSTKDRLRKYFEEDIDYVKTTFNRQDLNW